MDDIWLHICITCRTAPDDETEPCPGRRLHDAALELHRLAEAPRVAIAEAICLANCDRGCSASLSAPGKWSYLVGGLTPDLAEDLLSYAAAYAASTTGTVLRSRRPASLAHAIVGRIPPAGPAGPTLSSPRPETRS